MKLEEVVAQYAHHKQLATAYRAMMTDQLRTCHDLEQRIQRLLDLKPLGKRDRDKLIALIETGELQYNGADDSEPF